MGVTYDIRFFLHNRVFIIPLSSSFLNSAHVQACVLWECGIMYLGYLTYFLSLLFTTTFAFYRMNGSIIPYDNDMKK